MMQQKYQEKRRVLAKPPAGGRVVKVGSSLFSAVKDDARGLATILYGIQDSSEVLLPGDKLRLQQMVKEVLIKRALSPPPRRFNWRWRNFHPKPSRLSAMSSG